MKPNSILSRLMIQISLFPAVAFAVVLLTAMPGFAQETSPTAAASPQALTALDYFEIQQLANRYAHAIDTCANDGYDYADLYTDDGVFIDNYSDDGFSKGGIARAAGREQLARAAGGGSEGCKKPVRGALATPGDGAVAWNGWSHLMVNHIITPTPEGATGRVYLVTLGMDGPGSVARDGGYEDIYVKTAAGWRIKSRSHVRTRAWHHQDMQTPDLK
ncbi:MAG: Nuclear transport factor 2 family protein [Gammaproteobacteria bacterium]|nr:Nuclear transport factor 2 family protein [Gammaproteobacteria bacterium]